MRYICDILWSDVRSCEQVEMHMGQNTVNDTRLVSLVPDLAASFWEMMEEFAAAGEPILSAQALQLARNDFGAYIRLLEDMAQGIGLPPGYVPQTTYWLAGTGNDGTDGVVLLGEGHLRHTLTLALQDVGGHIGYRIRPAARGHGYGTRLLALLLEKARQHSLSRVLLTCDSDNIASARVIERNGGQLVSEGLSSSIGKQVRRYWIEL
jgi:predicted acetyltransferase